MRDRLASDESVPVPVNLLEGLLVTAVLAHARLVALESPDEFEWTLEHIEAELDDAAAWVMTFLYGGIGDLAAERLPDPDLWIYRWWMFDEEPSSVDELTKGTA